MVIQLEDFSSPSPSLSLDDQPEASIQIIDQSDDSILSADQSENASPSIGQSDDPIDTKIIFKETSVQGISLPKISK